MSDLNPTCTIIDVVDRSSITTKYFSYGNNSVAARYESSNVPGRSEPHKFYDSTDFETYLFNIQLAAAEEEGSVYTIDQVWKDHLWLKSFQYPQYGAAWSQARKPPRQAIVLIGEFYKVGTIETPTFDWSESPLDEHGYPHIIKASFTLSVEHAEPLSFEQVRAGL